MALIGGRGCNGPAVNSHMRSIHHHPADKMDLPHIELDSLIAAGSPPVTPRPIMRRSISDGGRAQPPGPPHHLGRHHHQQAPWDSWHPNATTAGAAFPTATGLFAALASSPAGRRLRHSTETSFKSIKSMSSIAASFASLLMPDGSACGGDPRDSTVFNFYAGLLVLLAAGLLAGTLQLLLVALRTACTLLLLAATHAEAACLVALVACATGVVAAQPWQRDSAAAELLAAAMRRAGGAQQIASVCVMASGVAIMLLASMQFHPSISNISPSAWHAAGASPPAITFMQADETNHLLMASRLLAYCNPSPPGYSPAKVARLQALLAHASAAAAAAAASEAAAGLPSHPPSLLSSAAANTARLVCNVALPTELRMLSLPFAARSGGLAPLAFSAAGAMVAARLWMAATYALVSAGIAMAWAGSLSVRGMLAGRAAAAGPRTARHGHGAAARGKQRSAASPSAAHQPPSDVMNRRRQQPPPVLQTQLSLHRVASGGPRSGRAWQPAASSQPPSTRRHSGQQDRSILDTDVIAVINIKRSATDPSSFTTRCKINDTAAAPSSRAPASSYAVPPLLPAESAPAALTPILRPGSTIGTILLSFPFWIAGLWAAAVRCVTGFVWGLVVGTARRLLGPPLFVMSAVQYAVTWWFRTVTWPLRLYLALWQAARAAFVSAWMGALSGRAAREGGRA